MAMTVASRVDRTGKSSEMEETHRILVVDDDVDVREILGRMLAEIGRIEVDCVEGGEAAISLIREGGIDLVFVDLRLPGMSGLELLRSIKGHDPALPVVVITGFPSVDSAIQAMKDGAADFITKPFRLQQIEHVIRKQILDEARTRHRGLSPGSPPSRDRAHGTADAKLDQKVKELSILYAISESMTGTDLDVERFYGRIVEMASTITGAERISLMVVDREANELRIKAAKGLNQSIIGSARVPLGSGVAGRVFACGKPLLVRDRRCSPLRKRSRTYRTESYVSIPLTIRGETFGVLNVTDKGDGSPFDKGEALLLLALARRAALNIENSLLYKTLHDSLVDTLQCLVTTLEAKDCYTRRHSARVTELATQVARQMSCTEEEIEGIRFGGLLHDIGKIGIRDAILQKSHGLTAEEYGLVQTHPIVGERIIRPLGLLPVETAVVRSHHERWDGGGYPDGLAEEEIPLLARILAVADSFDAMTSDRPYRAAKTWEQAIAELRRGIGSQFDGHVVEAFLQIDPVKRFVRKPKEST